MTKHLIVQQVNKLVSTPKFSRSTADELLYDAKMAAYGQNDNESSFKADGVRLEIERLKETVEKWKANTGFQNKLFLYLHSENNQANQGITDLRHLRREGLGKELLRTYIIYLKHDKMLFDSEKFYLAVLSFKKGEKCNILVCCATGFYPDNNVT